MSAHCLLGVSTTPRRIGQVAAPNWMVVSISDMFYSTTLFFSNYVRTSILLNILARDYSLFFLTSELLQSLVLIKIF